jgi:putative aldouronate transport system substrate-binding protein
LQAIKDAGIVEYPWYNTTSFMGALLDAVTDASGVVQSAYYLGSDGKYHWGPAEETTGIKETLGRIKEAYDAGLLYPEFYTLESSQDHAHYNASGDAAAIFAEGMAVWIDREDSEMQANLGVSYWDVGRTLVLTDDNGVAHANASTNYWACNILSPNIKPDVLDRILSLWDYGCTEEGQLRIRLGLPGIDWDYAEDGSIINLLADTEYMNADTKYTSTYPIYGNMFVLSDDYSFINPSFSARARERVAELYQTRAAVSTAKDREIDWIVNAFSSRALNLATMIYANEYANLIVKDGDFSANYDQWVAEKMLMVQPVLDELNDLLD